VFTFSTDASGFWAFPKVQLVRPEKQPLKARLTSLGLLLSNAKPDDRLGFRTSLM
jgi:hypothetical protein